MKRQCFRRESATLGAVLPDHKGPCGLLTWGLGGLILGNMEARYVSRSGVAVSSWRVAATANGCSQGSSFCCWSRAHGDASASYNDAPMPVQLVVLALASPARQSVIVIAVAEGHDVARRECQRDVCVHGRIYIEPANKHVPPILYHRRYVFVCSP